MRSTPRVSRLCSRLIFKPRPRGSRPTKTAPLAPSESGLIAMAKTTPKIAPAASAAREGAGRSLPRRVRYQWGKARRPLTRALMRRPCGRARPGIRCLRRAVRACHVTGAVGFELRARRTWTLRPKRPADVSALWLSWGAKAELPSCCARSPRRGAAGESFRRLSGSGSP